VGEGKKTIGLGPFSTILRRTSALPFLKFVPASLSVRDGRREGFSAGHSVKSKAHQKSTLELGNPPLSLGGTGCE